MSKKCFGLTGGLLLLLGGCADHTVPRLSDRPPSENFAKTALSDGAPEMALNVSETFLKSHPDDTDALMVRAGALVQLGRTQEAEAAYRGILARDPASAAAARGLGRLLLTTDPAGAAASFQQAIDHNAGDAASLNDLGIARDLQGQHAGAQAAYRQALAVSPDMTAATANLALSLSLSGHAAEGVQLIGPLAQRPDAAPRLRYDLAAVETMAGDRQAAASVLKADMPADKLQGALDGFAALAQTP